jgi:hypothetical protein
MGAVRLSESESITRYVYVSSDWGKRPIKRHDTADDRTFVLGAIGHVCAYAVTFVGIHTYDLDLLWPRKLVVPLRGI